jgi:hypothetical protein
MASAEICSNCRERMANTRGECRACSEYRRRTGKPRPLSLVVVNQSRPGNHRLHDAGTSRELRAILHPNGASRLGVEICAPCGTISAWTQGVPIPLCTMHRGWLVLAGLVLDDEFDRGRLMDAVSA